MDRYVEERILAWEREIQIDEARVRLECLWEESPPFRVHIHLVTPGPDLTSENRDHTLRAAADKALGGLEEKIRGKNNRRLMRLRGKGAQRAVAHCADRTRA